MQVNKLIKGRYTYNFPLNKLSYFKTGGPAEFWFEPADVDDLMRFMQLQDHNCKIQVLGNMSNVLIPDEGISGCVISLKNFQSIHLGNGRVQVQCGVPIAHLIKELAALDLSCLEPLWGIPGTLGGALAMNAGIPNFEIKDIVESIDVLNLSTGELETIQPEMTYRSGNFHGVAISCILKTAHKENINQELQAIFAKRLRTQPILAATCGSVFKNPDGKKAWELISRSGCRGQAIGGAKVSDLHCNFIVNENSATSKDIMNLIIFIKNKVFEQTGILLEEEIRYII